jgi:uncharacterized membrane protein
MMSPAEALPEGDEEGSCVGAGGVRWLVVVAVVIGAVAVLLALFAWAARGPPGGAPAPWPYPFFWPVFPFGFFLLFVALFALRGGWGGRYVRSARYSAIEWLELHYARGEIDRDEFLRRRHDLLDRGASDLRPGPGR